MKKNSFIRILAVALLAGVLLSSVACAKPNELPADDEITSPTEGADSIRGSLTTREDQDRVPCGDGGGVSEV